MGAKFSADGQLGSRAERTVGAHPSYIVRGVTQSDLGWATQGTSSAVIHGAVEAWAWLTLGGGSWKAVGSKILGGR